MSFDTTSDTAWGLLDLTAGTSLSLILDSLGVGVVVVDRGLTVKYRNTAARHWITDADSLPAAFGAIEVLGPFDGWTVAVMKVLNSRDVAWYTGTVRESPNATPRALTLRCGPLIDASTRRVAGVTIVIDDPPPSSTADEKHEVSQRLTSLGKLATRVAHELNNPLDGILRYINLALRIVGDAPEPKLKTYLSESRTGLMRMMQIIGDLLEFSRTTGGEFDEVGINEVIEEAIRDTSSAADAGRVVVAMDYQTQQMPAVRGSRLYQVCCNLIRNAIDAMPDGGRLSITSGVVADDVVIRVADTGVGLPTSAEKIFEPFFTTKAPGKGTGLGLAICKDFIEDMQGTITAAPGESGGAVVIVRIPLSGCAQAPRRMAGRGRRGIGGPSKETDP